MEVLKNLLDLFLHGKYRKYRSMPVDTLADAIFALARDVPFALRFHLAPRVLGEIEPEAEGTARLKLPGGMSWRFTARGAALSLEPSVHYAEPTGVARTRQLVLRGSCWGETRMEWRLERLSA